MRKLLPVGALALTSLVALSACGGGAATTATSSAGTTTSSSAASTGASSGSSSSSSASSAGSSSASSAASSSAAAPAAGALLVWVDSNREAAIKNIVGDFEKQTGVKINLVVKDFDKIKDEAVAQIPTGNGPDVFIGPHDQIGTYVKNGIISPVELGAKKTEFRDVAAKAVTYDGKTYGVPVSVENLALVRNTKLAPAAPASWEEMVKTGTDLVTAGTAEQPFLIQQGKDGDPYHLYPVQASYGANVFDLKSDGSYDASKLAMNSEAGVTWAKALAAMGQQKQLSLDITGDIAKEQFAAGKSPYMITGPWNLDFFKKQGVDYAIEAVPSAGGKPATPFVGVQAFFVSAKTKQTLAATKFVLDFMGSEKVQNDVYQAGHRAPANSKAYDAAKADADLAAFGKVGDAGVPMPNIPAMAAVWNYWGATEAQLISGAAADPAAAWQEMCTKIEADMKK